MPSQSKGDPLKTWRDEKDKEDQKGPGKNGETIKIARQAAIKGQYVGVQLMQTTKAIINLGDIEIYARPGKNLIALNNFVLFKP